jgi:hypothetical protein
MAKHFKAETFGDSYCEATDEFAVYSHNETDQCTACGEVEPEWLFMTPEEFAEAARKH